MNVNNYRNQYIKLSMAIKRAKEKGLDPSQLLTEREQLKLKHSYQKVNTVNSANNVNKRVNNSVRLTVNQELLTTIQELKKQLENITNSLTDQKEQLTTIFPQIQNYFTEFLTTKFTNQQPKKPTEISVKKEPRKVIIKEPKTSNSTTQSPTNKVTLRFDKNLLAEVQSFLTNNPQSFPSFSHFFRDGLLAYKNGLKINDQQKFITSEKKSLRLNQELQNFCLGLPEGKKYLILNQILSAFLVTCQDEN